MTSFKISFARSTVISVPVSEENATMVKEAPLSLLVPMWLLVLANIYFGLDTQLTVGVAEQAVKVLGVAAK